MKLLADAHISRLIVQFLLDSGNDVLHAGSLPPRLPDSEILQLAADQQRVVLTADKDFGELVFHQLIPCPGVILLRLSEASEQERVAILQRSWAHVEAHAAGHFIVISDDTIQRTRLP